MGARLYIAALAAVGLVAAACTDGGPAPGVQLPSGANEHGGSTYEPPGGGEEPAGGGEESPGGSYESPGTNPVTAGGNSGGACLACTTYTCQLSGGGTSQTSTIDLVPISGGCSSDLGLALLCGGGISLVEDGGEVTSTEQWKAVGQGGFSLEFTDVNGSETVTCLPGGSSLSGGGTVTSTSDAG